MNLNNQLRLLWGQHVYWTRLFISGVVFGNPDVKATEARLLRNPEDFAAVLRPFYGEKASGEFQRLFTEHLTIAGRLVTELKAGDKEAADETRRQWYANAEELAAFFSSAHSGREYDEWKEMMDSHLALTEQEARALLGGNYEESIRIFDEIEKEAMEMADMMKQGAEPV